MARKPDTRDAYHQLSQTMRALETDLRWGLEGSGRIPEAWNQIAQEAYEPAKEKITLRLDEDVLRFFRSMGRGHYRRINAVLRAFMLARLAGVVKAAQRYEPSIEDQEVQVKAEIKAVLIAQLEARDTAMYELTEDEKRKSRLMTLRLLRDARAKEG